MLTVVTLTIKVMLRFLDAGGEEMCVVTGRQVKSQETLDADWSLEVRMSACA